MDEDVQVIEVNERVELVEDGSPVEVIEDNEVATEQTEPAMSESPTIPFDDSSITSEGGAPAEIPPES